MRRTAPAAAAGLLALFLVLAVAVLTGCTAPFDRALLAALRNPGAPGIADVPAGIVAGARLLTHAGDFPVRSALAVGGALGLAATRRRLAAAALLLAWGGGALLVELVKALVARARPDLAWRLVQAHAPSFPSGHAAGTMILYPLLGWYCGRRVGLGAGIAVAMLVGLTRVLLGVHWASDVAAGWLLGGAIACLAAPAGDRSGRRSVSLA